MSLDAGLVWFRRDLRLADHAALAAALKSCRRVHCVFVYDRAILDELLAAGLGADRRVEFIHAAVADLDEALRRRGGGLRVTNGRAAESVVDLARRLGVDAVFANADYEPYATVRDADVARQLGEQGRRLLLFKDQVILEKSEVMTGAGTPFSVFTPYRNAWLKRLQEADVAAHATEAGTLAPPPAGPPLRPSLAQLGFKASNLGELSLPLGEAGALQLLDDFVGRIGDYRATRDFPALRGPSYLSVHLRFGTVSIRELVRRAREQSSDGASTWLSELVWREFYQMVLWHHPHVVDRAFRPEYDRIEWETGPQAEEHFRAWCEGRTGYPIVDAGMRQLNQTGYMHNRLRMIAASFLTKDLGIDWRRGERYFAQHLNDYDLAANNGGWQWAASTGCDAQPYFRIFNPVTQSRKFDAEGRFIRRYVPEISGLDAADIHAPWLAPAERQRAAGAVIGRDYPAPLVDHAEARQATLRRYAVVKNR
ncbi:MAG: deoxyribodipyrimidine photo-lyase [Burkholderiaceae bacterium]